MDKLILADSDYLQQVKQELPADIARASNAIFYIGDTGIDGKLSAHIGGNLHSVISLLVSAAVQNETIRHMILISASHLK